MELPGCTSQGATREKAMAGIREAVAGYGMSGTARRTGSPSIDEAAVEVRIQTLVFCGGFGQKIK